VFAGTRCLTQIRSSQGLPPLINLHTHAFLSSRPWIEEGLAHFAQAIYLEQQKGRKAALDYMGLHRSAYC